MARVYHIEPKRKRKLLLVSSVTPVGALATFVSPGPTPNPVVPVSGAISPSGEVASETSGPSEVTIPLAVDGTISPTSSLLNEATGLGIIITVDITADLRPTGEVAAVASGPSNVTLTQSKSGSVTPAGALTSVTNADTGTVTQSKSGTITPGGVVATAVSGPSLVTITQSKTGTVTPAGAVTSVLGSVEVIFNVQGVGTITPSGTVARAVSGPSLITITQSKSGSVTPVGAPLGVVRNPFTGISTQAVDGTITPAAIIVRQVFGPSIITITQSKSGSVTPVGVVTKSISGSNQFQMNRQGTITPHGVVATVVSGPSITTKFKSIAGSMAPSGVLTKTASGPSKITIPVSRSGSITPRATVARVVGGLVVINKAVTGRITPGGLATRKIVTTPPPGSPIFPGWMSHEDTTTWDDAPHFSCTVTVPTPSNIATIRAAARANHFKVFLRLSGNSPNYSGHDAAGGLCCFDINAWKSGIARFTSLISSADSDWLVGNYLIDEPYINNWYGGTITPDTLKSLAQYSKQLYPWLDTTIRAESKYLSGGSLPTGGWGGLLNFGWANFNRAAINNNLTYLQFFQLNINQFASIGISKYVLGHNIFNGGLGGSGIPSSDGISGHWFASAQEIKDCFDQAYPFASSTYYQIWKLAEAGDSTQPYIPYFTRSDYVAAWDYIVGKSAGRGSSSSSSVVIAVGDNWQTKVNAQPAGTAFTIKAGVHKLQSVVPKASQSFTGETGAIMSGSRTLTGWTSDGASHWYVGGQTQQNTYNPNYECQLGHDGCFYPEQLWVNDTLYEHMTTLAAVTPGSQKWFFDYAADRIYIATNPAGLTIETSVATSAFTGNNSDVIIRNLIVEKYANAAQIAVVDGGPGWIIENCEVRYNHGTGIGIASNGIMRNNYVHHQGQMGVKANGMNGLVEGNEIAYNNTAFFGGGHYGEAGAGKFVLTTGLIVRNNWSHHNHGPGLWTDINNVNTLYEGNTVEDNDWRGIFHEISYNAIIRNNIVRRNGFHTEPNAGNFGAGILVSGSPDVEVYGNTVTDNFHGIMALDGDRTDHPSTLGPHNVTNLYVHDNTITQTDNGRAAGIYDSDPTADPYSAAANNVWANNIYHRSLGVTRWRWVGSLDVTEAVWRAAQDAGSTFGA